MLRRDFIAPQRRGKKGSKGREMKRRDVMALIAGAAAWPMAVRAQERSLVPRVGVLWHAADANG